MIRFALILALALAACAPDDDTLASTTSAVTVDNEADMGIGQNPPTPPGNPDRREQCHRDCRRAADATTERCFALFDAEGGTAMDVSACMFEHEEDEPECNDWCNAYPF